MSSRALPPEKIITPIAGVPMELYRLDSICGFTVSYAQAIKAIDETEPNLRKFIDSVPAKSLTEVNLLGELTLQAAAGYWLTQALKGNQKAQALIFALVNDSLENRAEIGFGFKESNPISEAIREDISETLHIIWLSKDKPRSKF